MLIKLKFDDDVRSYTEWIIVLPISNSQIFGQLTRSVIYGKLNKY